MSDPAPEFSRPVPLTRIGSEPFRQEIVASDAERAALVKRFALVSLDRLAATVELVRERGGTILLTAQFSAEFAQECVVSLELVAGSANASFTLRYGPTDAEPESESDDDPAFEPLTGDAIDIGEAVAQEFSLSLPPFPRAPGVAIDELPPEPEGESPFAVLARTKPDG
ncbi:MAG TPA: DUF177 domain-containing protein [Stellaceae bacterium]|nr:DUF177 domain-containing protein [Stellaceae bacterium]